MSSDKKRDSWTEEEKITFPHFERCYYIEQEETPEEQRNDISSHNDRTLIEMLRLGGVNGNPRGLYPAEIVAEVWDKNIRKEPSEAYALPEAEQYYRDLELVRQRVKDSWSAYLLGYYFCDRMYFGTQGIMLFDVKMGKYHDFGSEIMHETSCDDLVAFALEFNRDAHDFVKGRYFCDPNSEDLTRGVNTRVVYLENLVVYPENLVRIKDCESEVHHESEMQRIEGFYNHFFQKPEFIFITADGKVVGMKLKAS